MPRDPARSPNGHCFPRLSASLTLNAMALFCPFWNLMKIPALLHLHSSLQPQNLSQAHRVVGSGSSSLVPTAVFPVNPSCCWWTPGQLAAWDYYRQYSCAYFCTDLLVSMLMHFCQVYTRGGLLGHRARECSVLANNKLLSSLTLPLAEFLLQHPQ